MEYLIRKTVHYYSILLDYSFFSYNLIVLWQTYQEFSDQKDISGVRIVV